MKKLILTFLCLGLASMFVAYGQTTDPNPPKKNEVNQRQKNQRARIKQGEQSGELTKGEAHNLKGEEKGIHQQVKAERQANGGKLTKQERRQVNKEQNQESKQIYKDKHNGRVRKKR